MRKIVGVVLAASLAAWAASPAEAFGPPPGPPPGPFAPFWFHHHHHHFHPGGGSLNAWPAFVIIGAAASVMINAAIVWNTQCRELTGQEAFISAFLPFIGVALSPEDNRCKR